MSLAISVLVAALLAVQLGIAVQPRRAPPPRPANPAPAAPVRVAGDLG
jgi:hypothetical protein